MPVMPPPRAAKGSAAVMLNLAIAVLRSRVTRTRWVRLAGSALVAVSRRRLDRRMAGDDLAGNREGQSGLIPRRDLTGAPLR